MDAARLRYDTLGIRENSVGGYLLERLANNLVEAFVITQLVEEAMTVDYDKASSYKKDTGQKAR